MSGCDLNGMQRRRAITPSRALFAQVDFNVTRHLPLELSASDWSGLFLHYLGVDHIGHFMGPHSAVLPGKLREMDDVIKTLVENLVRTWLVDGCLSPSTALAW